MPRNAPSLLLLAGLALLAAGAEAQFTQAKLPVDLKGLEPVISEQTMNYHYNKHYATYIKNLNAAYGNRKAPASLTDAIQSVGQKGTLNATAIRKQGGGAWNHALYFKALAPPNSAATKQAAVTPQLADAVRKAYGSFDAMKKNVSDAAMGVFGSGWAWVCLTPGGELVTVTTANQDNPLMGEAVSGVQSCTPIFGIDVWEHAYYVDHGPARKDYVDNFWNVVSWPQVSANFAAAQKGKIDDIVA